MVHIQVHGSGSLACSQLVGVTEGVLQKLHHGNNTRRLVFDPLDRCTCFTQVGEGKGHAAAALRQLQGTVDGPRDRLHVVFDAEQEAGNQFATGLLASVQESGGSGLEPPRKHLINQVACHVDVAARQVQRNHANAVFEPLQVTLPVKGLQRVGGVVLERPKEGCEAVLPGVGLLEQILDVLKGVLAQHLLLVIPLLHQVTQLLFQVMEVNRVLVYVAKEILARRQAVRVKLDLPVLVVQVQLRVQRVIVAFGGKGRLQTGVRQMLNQNFFSPSFTNETSREVPRSSNLYRWGTPTLFATMSPALQ